jgi:sec-independent protein translocase protein TatC
MTLIGHLEELRTRLFFAIGAWVVGSGVAFGFRFDLIEWLKEPLPAGLTLHTFHLLEPFTVSMQVAGFFGLVIAAPVIGGQVWGFVAPGLYAAERRWAVPFIFLTALAFTSGVLFARYVALPFSIPVIVSFLGHEVTMLLSTASYISTLLLFMGVFGLVFEMPVLGFLLGRLGLVTSGVLARNRRYAIVIGTVLAAGITPTADPVNLALVAVPLIVLYELTIWIVRFSERKEGHERENPELTPTD